RLRAIEGACDVDGEDGAPIWRRDRFERAPHLAEDAAGIVDENMDLVRAMFGLGDERLHLFGVADVDAANGAGVAAQPARFLELVGKQVAGPDPCAARHESLGDGAAEAMGGAGDDDRAVVEAEIHEAATDGRVSASTSSSAVLWLACPSSMDLMSASSRVVIGAATPRSAATRVIWPSWASPSVRRLRTARSRQMPLWVLAERGLKATSSSIDRMAWASVAPAMKARGSKPSNGSSFTPSARATAATSRANAMKVER